MSPHGSAHLGAPSLRPSPPPCRYENVLWLDEDDLDRGASAASASAASASTAAIASAKPQSDSAAVAATAPVPAPHVSLFVAEKDRYVDGGTIYADAQAAIERRSGQRLGDGAPPRRELRAVLWEGIDHGAFLQCDDKRRQVIESIIGAGAGADDVRA